MSDQEMADVPAEGLADVLAEKLTVVFVGINPAPLSVAAGHSFATPGNRFWPALHASGFTPVVLRPQRERDLLDLGLGITSIVRRPTSRAAQLTPRELADGGRDLTRRLRTLSPRWAAFLGVSGYRAAFGAPQARLGAQAGTIGGARVWILPNPSGRNAHFPPAALAAEFTRLRQATGLPDRSAPS
ncbi:mismatch-specific DNA-glycosylase [Sphaerisporangium sp. TRM90804]|uniref:mismatch-specific DNA-glycosylase n=1 Tax=Sphaerisporangium sp. TRM90804 TaxID=3031113 RepID=UPI00244BD811|nr:mismatch-specific DNA-glycosylase [Sphaerisporangium sp. TRM90804]MDH2426043.1 mismatch-specific DNA-glycosylase [Sphaerisporangium sp. TRM90804]